MNTAKTKELICEAYGINFVGISTTKEWFTKFGKCDFHLNNQPRSGKLKETIDADLQELLNEDATKSTRDLKKHLQVNIQKRLRDMRKILKDITVFLISYSL